MCNGDLKKLLIRRKGMDISRSKTGGMVRVKEDHITFV
jgi:hypothetical protein